MVVPQLVKLFEPWNTLYGNSKVVSTSVTTVHVVSLLFAGGFAVATDRTTLRALRGRSGERVEHLQELRAVHGPVVAAMALLFLSGLAMAAADVKTYATSVYFWVKMGLIALLLVNGSLMLLTERRLAVAGEGTTGPAPHLWRWLHRASVSSLVLWTLTTIAGTVLAGAA